MKIIQYAYISSGYDLTIIVLYERQYGAHVLSLACALERFTFNFAFHIVYDSGLFVRELYRRLYILSCIQCIEMIQLNMQIFAVCRSHRHSNSGPPFFLIWSLPRLWYGSFSGSISLNHLSIFYNISCYNSLVLLTFVSRSSCRITYIYIKV